MADGGLLDEMGALFTGVLALCGTGCDSFGGDGLRDDVLGPSLTIKAWQLDEAARRDEAGSPGSTYDRSSHGLDLAQTGDAHAALPLHSGAVAWRDERYVRSAERSPLARRRGHRRIVLVLSGEALKETCRLPLS
jgi:hypothetical protein